MATANSTRRSAGSSLSAQTDEFAALFRRLLVAINQVALVTQHFGDLAGLDSEDVPAGVTLQAASRDLDRLYNELDAWDVRHEHFRKFGEISPVPTSELGEGQQRFHEVLARHRDVGALLGKIAPEALGREEVIRALDNAETHLGDAVAQVRRACGTVSPSRAEIPVRDEERPPALPSIGYSDKTADRIRAFLMSVRPVRDGADVDGGDTYQRGRILIERMATSAKDEDYPSIALSFAHCADVLRFLSSIEPFEPATWWSDPKDAPSHVIGFVFVLRTLETSLRRRAS